jgi:AMP phosphorylase
MAGKLLELSGKIGKDKGYAAAENLIKNGKALSKFREIVELQGGDKNVKSTSLSIGKYTQTICSQESGSIFHIDNKCVSKIARIAGAPRDKGAGVFLHRIRGDRVEKGDKLFTIYADSEAKLEFAIKAANELETIEMRKMLLGSLQ